MILRGTTHFTPPSRILLIQLRRIGDVLLGTPAIRALAHCFPEAQIDFVAESPADEVLWGHPLIGRLLTPPRDRKLSSFVRFVRELRRARYDWVIDFFSNPRSAQFSYFSGAPVRVGLDRLGRRWAYTHRIVEEEGDRDAYAVDLRLRILEHMNVPPAGRELEIHADKADVREAERARETLNTLPRRGPVVAVAAGSANPAKRYPADLTVEVIRSLRQQGCEIVLTSGPGETVFGTQILSGLDAGAPFLSDARVPTLAALYRQVALYVGPDSGPKHVAVACGIPTVTIFGPGRPSNWNDPQSAKNIVLTAPCDVRPNCIESECARRECLRRIPPADVISAALRLLGKQQARP